MNKLSELLNKICIIIIKSYSNKYLFDIIINKYITLLNIFELSKIIVIVNNIIFLNEIIIHIDDYKKIELIEICLSNKTNESYDSIRFLFSSFLILDDEKSKKLYNLLIKVCKNGDKKFIEIMLSGFNYNIISWMLPSVTYIAFSYNYIKIVDYIFSYYPELFNDIKDIYINKQKLYFANLYNYLNSKLNLQNILNNEFLHNDNCEECSICLYKHDTYIKTTCGHIFGKDCIIEWINLGKSSCPYCRSNL